MKPKPSLTSRAWAYRLRHHRRLQDIPQQIAIEKAWLAGFHAGKRSAAGKKEEQP